MTANEPQFSAQDRTRRAIAAMPLAMVSFTVPYVAMFTTIQWTLPVGEGGFADLAYFAALLLLGTALLAVFIPIVVFTLGKALDDVTRHRGTSRAALIFGGAGLGLGLLLAVVMAWALEVSLVATVANVAVPAAIGGLGTRLLLPWSLAHRAVFVLSWVFAAIPLAGLMILVLSLRVA
jgi:uncharacterized protein YacL